MKKSFVILGSILVLSTGALFAQSTGTTSSNSVSGVNSDTSAHQAVGHDVTGFSNPYTGPGVTKEEINRAPNPNVVLKPKLGGAGVAVAKYGPVMLSPTAPASYGNGERYLAAPDARYDLDHESGPAAHRDTGGIKLFSIEF
jgi:hypothetical protein